jgi:3-oxoadipate enol-lactonase
MRRPRVFWRSRGSGDATLVLINGYSASALAWPRPWIRALAENARVISLDNRGSGWSRDVAVPFTIAEMAADVVDVLDDAEVEQAVVMGFSMGGMVAQELALDSPERVAALTLVGTRPPIPKFTQPPLSSLFALTRPVLPGEGLHKYLTRLWGSAAAPGFAAANPEAIAELVEQTVARPTPRRMLLEQLRAMSGWGHADRLRELRLPTVVVHGTEDRFSPSANGQTLAELIPGARLEVLPGVGHLVPLEAPECLLATLRDQLGAAQLTGASPRS